MPLPANGTPWPPRELRNITPTLDVWDAWYAGDPDGLTKAYQNNRAPKVRPSQLAGGVVGAVSRWFWGAAPASDTPRQKLHIPVAADLCQASADLLFSEAPTIAVPEPKQAAKTQDRLDELLGDGAHTVFAEAAEIGAALGGSFLRVTWDSEIADAPFLTAVHADAAWPEFRWGRLVAVTFWHVVHEDGQRVIRHLERHELRDRVGVILHGLYEGTPENLGRAIPLTESQATAGIRVDAESMISTESPGLAVRYIPNQRPQRGWRKDPLGKDLGRSDLDGVEGLMDALDETYTSWIRDIRLGKARVFATREMLTDLGPGKGAMLDLDQEIFSPIGSGIGSLNQSGGAGTAQSFLLPQQFAIRYAEHEATAKNLKEQILRTAGYSSQTFGEGDFGNDVTATEVQVKQQRSFSTRDRKIRAWRPELAELAEKLLWVDQAIFGSKVEPQRLDVEFADGVQDSMLTLAQTAQALDAASAASRDTIVRLVHPDWDDDQVDAEVALINAEYEAKNPPLMDPMGGAVPEDEQGVTGGDTTDTAG